MKSGKPQPWSGLEHSRGKSEALAKRLEHTPDANMMDTDRPTPQVNRRTFLSGTSSLVAFSGIGSVFQSACSPELPANEIFSAVNFSYEEFQMVSELSDMLIPATDTPGAIGADVPKFLDALMSDWANLSTKTEIQTALAAIEARSQTRTGKRFSRSSESDRISVLEDYEAECFAANTNETENEMGFAGYRKFKELVYTVYYRSEIGCEQELQFELNPGPGARADAPLSEIGRTWVAF